MACMHALCVRRQNPLKVTLPEPVSQSGFVWVIAKIQICTPVRFFNFTQKFMLCVLNSFPNDKILAVTKLKAFSHHKSNVAYMIIISVSYREENILGKEESACYQHFLLFSTFFFEPVRVPNHARSCMNHV